MEIAATYPFDNPQAYENYIGRWSKLVAPAFLDWLDTRANLTWLDIGCGTGVLAQKILERCSPKTVSAGDVSASFVSYARGLVRDSRVTFRVTDACNLPDSDNAYDVVVCGLVLPALVEQHRAISEFVRVTKPGGTVAAYVWDFDTKMEMLRYFWDAATELDPDADEPGDEARFAICKPDNLAALFRECDLHEVEVRAIDVTTEFSNFEDYWRPFLSGDAPAQRHVQSLSEEKRAALRASLKARLLIRSDGSISLIARAWAAKGSKPARVF